MRVFQPTVYNGDGSASSPGGGFSSATGASAGQVPAGTQVSNPSTGQTGNADGYGGVHINK